MPPSAVTVKLAPVIPPPPEIAPRAYNITFFVPAFKFPVPKDKLEPLTVTLPPLTTVTNPPPMVITPIVVPVKVDTSRLVVVTVPVVAVTDPDPFRVKEFVVRVLLLRLRVTFVMVTMFAETDAIFTVGSLLPDV
jgi:hypothetical protein